MLLAACGSETNPPTSSATGPGSSSSASVGSGGAGGSGGQGSTSGSSGTGGEGTGGAGGSAEAMYVNPVIPSDFADPSVIRVGNEYWATATSSEWGPTFPLLRSMDLVNWEHVGSIFKEPPAWSYANYWAPEIQEDNGKFYIFYTAHQKNGPLCVAVATADTPSGPYQDQGPLVCQMVGSIDGFSIRDESGVRYLIWKEDSNSVGQPTSIWAQELSDDGKQLLGQKVELFKNEPSWEANLVEGPFVLKRNDTFYAFYSAAGCCGKNCSYALGVARSKALLGPWEKNPNNPILAANADWKCPGHGSIVTDENGRYFLLYHAYSVKDTVYVGRQGMLDEVVFGADDWPTINGGKGPSSMAPAPSAPQLPRPDEVLDEFTDAALKPGWQWLVAGGVPDYTIDTASGGRLVLSAVSPGPGNQAGAVLAQSTRSGDYEATTELVAEAGVSAGLAAVGDGDNALGISVVSGKAVVWRMWNGMSQSLAEESASGKTTLRMSAGGGHVYSFSISSDGGKSWLPAGGPVDSQSVDPDLPPWDRAVRVGLVASGPMGTSATFEYLRIVGPVANP